MRSRGADDAPLFIDCFLRYLADFNARHSHSVTVEGRVHVCLGEQRYVVGGRAFWRTTVDNLAHATALDVSNDVDLPYRYGLCRELCSCERC